MAFITPKHAFSHPSEFEEPYFASAKSFGLGVDAATFANAENSQLQFMSEGIIGWDATAVDADTGLLFWADNIFISPFTVPIAFRARIDGPASIELTDGEVLYFVMPRDMLAETPVQLYRSNRIFLPGTRLHDLRLFAARVGTTVYFYNGKSLTDGDSGPLFGGSSLPAPSIFPAHTHESPIVFMPPPATPTLNIGITTATGLGRAYLYRNGMLQITPDDYTLNPGTGIITLVVPSVLGDRFVVLIEKIDTSVVFSTHTHLTPLKMTPPPATTMLDILVTTPVLQSADLFRNGMIQVDPDDYSLDVTTGFVTLVTPTVVGERFVALRRVNI